MRTTQLNTWPKTLSALLTITELGMLLYWVFAGLVVFGVVDVDPAAMYPDHTDPTVAAKLSIFSLSLMFCAGLMAVSFWTIVGFYGIGWWVPNLWLVFISVVAVLTQKAHADESQGVRAGEG